MNLSAIDHGNSFDFGRTSAEYAKYRDIYPAELYDRLRRLGVAADGTAWLDLGTGTGVLPKNLYNPNASITGADISAGQIALARQEAERNGWKIAYVVAPAEKTGLPSQSFDAVTAAQCFWYFDREKMRDEIRRLLRPGGIFIKIFMNWDFDDPVAAESVALVEKFNPRWSSGKNAHLDLYDDLFPGRVTETFSADVPFSRESWHGRMCACRGTLASMEADYFALWEKKHRKLLSRCPERFTVKHKIYISYFVLSDDGEREVCK